MEELMINIDNNNTRLIPIKNSSWYKDLMDNLYRKNWKKSDDSNEIIVQLERFNPKTNSWTVVKKNI